MAVRQLAPVARIAARRPIAFSANIQRSIAPRWRMRSPKVNAPAGASLQLLRRDEAITRRVRSWTREVVQEGLDMEDLHQRKHTAKLPAAFHEPAPGHGEVAGGTPAFPGARGRGIRLASRAVR